MAIRKEAAVRPTIATVEPDAAITNGEFQIRGQRFAVEGHPKVTIGEEPASLMIASDTHIVARVPEGALTGEIVVHSGALQSEAWDSIVGLPIADSLHPVANPAVDQEGNVYSTFSGSRGQKSPVSIYKIDSDFTSKPFVTDLMNPTGLAFDRDGLLYVSSRFDGIIYQVTPTGNMSVFVEGMGVATGIAFDADENLYVGDRSGTIFKISRSRQIYVFATLEASIAAYHLAFAPRRLSVHHRTHHLELRQRLPDLHGRRSGDVSPRIGTAAGFGLRRGGQPVRRGVAERPAWRDSPEDHWNGPAA